MIYLTSDDSFFTLGVKEVFNSTKKDITLIDVARGKESLIKMSFTHEDILLIALEQADVITPLLATARKNGTKVLLIMDNASDNHQGVLSKKMPLDALLKFLDADMTYMNDLFFLTRQEIRVMRGLTIGKTQHSLAREFNLSVKTICCHKVNALRKLGLNHLNARSVLIFGKICRGLSTF